MKQKRLATLSLLSVYIICFVLIILRWIHIFNENIVIINSSITFHITNFTLSILLCVFVGYLLIILNKKFIYILIIAIFVIVLNFVYELFLPLLNTRDIVDAIYGCVGSICSLGYLYFIYNYGFVKDEERF